MEKNAEQAPKQSPLQPPFKKGEKRTIEMARKAGKVKTKRKAAAVRMNARKHCDSKCPIYRDCPYMFESMRTDGKPCGLKKSTPETQRRVWDILRKGDPELIMEMRRVLVKMGGLVDNTDSVKELAIYGDQLRGLHETLHGKFVRQEVKADANINVSWEGALRSRKGKKKGTEIG